MKKNHFLKFLVISIILCSLLASSCSNLCLDDFQNSELSKITTKKSYSLADSLILHKIYSSSEWGIIPGILGTGTDSDPYIIKDIVFKDDLFFLSAKNSEAFVIIENCTFSSDVDDYWYFADLNFDECVNIEINNCRFFSRSKSLSFSNCSQFTITNSEFYTYTTQVKLSNCQNFEISSNLFEYCMSKGISLINCTDGCISSNFITGSENRAFFSGMSISGNSKNLTIRDNVIQYFRYSGIKIDLSANLITISNNTIYNSKYDVSIGIAQYGSKNCLIEENHIYNLGKDGVLLQECENITVYQNIINNNSQNGISIINSSIINILQNTIVNNSNYGLFSNLSTYLNLEENIISNNQNGDIIIVKIPFYQKNWFIIISALGLIGIEFFILIKRNQRGKIQTDRIKNREFDYDNSKVMKTKVEFHYNFKLYWR